MNANDSFDSMSYLLVALSCSDWFHQKMVDEFGLMAKDGMEERYKSRF